VSVVPPAQRRTAKVTGEPMLQHTAVCLEHITATLLWVLVCGCRGFSTFYLHGYKKAEAGSKRSSVCTPHASLQGAAENDSTAAPASATMSAAAAGADTSTAADTYSSIASSEGMHADGSDTAMLAHRRHLHTSHQLARSAFDFVVSSLRLPDSGLFAWMSTRNGSSILQANTVLYGQCFVLYGFSQYYAAFGDVRAKQYALDCFRALDAAWHNSSTGGYTE
jgi:hypothetical protein